jgi:predicted esterase
MMLNSVRFPILICSLILVTLAGCAVPQRPGRGTVRHLVEPETQTGYWLYLPEDYEARSGQHPQWRRWPVVVTLHGLRPYDNAKPQIRSWQEEADRYRFIVIAPELETCDSVTMQFPLRDPSKDYVRQDEKAIIAILDEVCRRTNADPHKVLATSFSSGGYLAHYMVNRHPERFSCLAVRGSNFSDSLLDYSQIPKYRDTPIGIFFGQNDFKVCKRESIEAIKWYQRYHFYVLGKQVEGYGHQRHPETAAAFFAWIIGASPRSTPKVMQLTLLDVPGTGSSAASPPRRGSPFDYHVESSSAPVVSSSDATEGTSDHANTNQPY